MGQHRTAAPPVVTNPIDHDKIVEFVLSADPRGRDLSAPKKKKREEEILAVINGSTHAQLSAALGASLMSNIGDESNSASEHASSGGTDTPAYGQFQGPTTRKLKRGDLFFPHDFLQGQTDTPQEMIDEAIGEAECKLSIGTTGLLASRARKKPSCSTFLKHMQAVSVFITYCRVTDHHPFI